jgi:hypothetical protein
MNLDMIINPFRETWKLNKKSFRDLFIDFAKIYFITFIIGGLIGGAIIAMVVALGVTGSIAEIISNPPLLVGLALIGAILFAGISIITTAITTTMYPTVKAREKGKGIPIIKTAKEFLPRVAKYLLIVWGAMFLIFIPALIVVMIALFVEGLGILVFAAPLVALISLIVYVVFAFLIQFAIIELAIKGKGAMDSINASVAMVKKNWLAVLGFDIMVFLVAFAIGLVSSVIQQIAGFLMVFAIINIAIMVLVIGLIVLISVITAVVTAMATTPAFYFFWRSMSK